ncbi:MAG: hypothetical protein C5B50_03945 [Verrucomicrobia bacterium]|nr:MAG: hypothetical protein C5B50_03945 [Verrucomicrobiota bacterium]
MKTGAKPSKRISAKRALTAFLATISLAVPACAQLSEVFVYDNRANNSGFFAKNGGATNLISGTTSNTITRLGADDITPISGYSGLPVSNIFFAVINGDSVAVSARPRIRIYQGDGANGGPGTLVVGYTFSPISFAANSGSAFYFHPTGLNLPSGTFWMGMTFDNNFNGSGATDSNLNNLGMAIFDPPVAGSSDDVFFLTDPATSGSYLASNPTGTFTYFGGSPVANFYFAVSVLASNSPSLPPVANSQTITLLKNSTAVITLSGSDPGGNPLSYTLQTFPTNGTLSGTAPNLSYQPNTDYTGPDAFSFSVNNGTTDSVPALVSMSVINSLGLIINPTFDASITTDPNAGAIMSAINSAIAVYESKFYDNVTVNILFAQITTGLGQSQTYVGTTDWTTYLNALTSDIKTTNDVLAVANLPGGLNNPVDHTSQITLTTANFRALGINVNPPGSYDSTVSINVSLCNLYRPPADRSKYDIMAVASHEIDEVLGTSSGLGRSHIRPPDLFRYSSTPLVRSYTTSFDDAYFSLDGVNDLARYNQDSGGDYGDWWSISSHSPIRVQDAFGSPGTTPDLGVELTVLDAIGWDLAVYAGSPSFLSTSNSGSSIRFTWSSVFGRTYQVQYETNINSAAWINLGGPITATGPTTSASDAIGPDAQRYYRVGLLPPPIPAPPLTDPNSILHGPLKLSTHILNPAPDPRNSASARPISAPLNWSSSVQRLTPIPLTGE